MSVECAIQRISDASKRNNSKMKRNEKAAMTRPVATILGRTVHKTGNKMSSCLSIKKHPS